MEIVIATWIGIVGFAILGIVGSVYFFHYASEYEDWKGILGGCVSIIVALAICVALAWFLYGTESGSRALKDFQSDVGGGIERTVTVYDMEGDVIAEYSGKFDVESDNEKIKFDDEDGKRHIIYFTTGTITIDED